MNFSGFQAAGIRGAEPLMHLVADQIAQLPWQSPREFGRNVEVPVLFLAQPSASRRGTVFRLKDDQEERKA